MFDFGSLFGSFFKDTGLGDLGTMAKLGSVLFEGLGKQADYAGEIKATNYNSRIARQNIAISQQQEAVALERQKRESYLRAGAARASAGANGLGLGGSAGDILADNAAQDELSLLNIKYAGQLERRGYSNDIGLNNIRAKTMGRAAQLSKGATLLKGVSTFAGTVLE